MKKKIVIVLPVILLLLVIGYLFGAPIFQINGYKATIKTNQLALSTGVSKAIGAARQSAFLDPTATIVESKNAAKISKDAASDLESKIQSNEKSLTDFSEFPMVASVNNGYKNVLDIRSLEAQYVAVSKDYLAEFKSVNTYNEKTIPILETMEQVQSDITKIGDVSSEEELTTKINDLIVKLDQIAKTADLLKPAESQKEIHELSVRTIKDVITIMKQLQSSLAAHDIDQIMNIYNAFTEKTVTLQKESKDLELRFVEKSKLAQLGDKLNDLNKQIDTKTANW